MKKFECGIILCVSRGSPLSQKIYNPHNAILDEYMQEVHP